MFMLNVCELYKWIYLTDTIAAFFSIFLNSMFIYVVLKYSPRHLGGYKYLMISISSFEIFYSMLEALITPIHYSYRSFVAVFINTTDTRFSRETLIYLNSVYFGFFGCSMAIFALHFIYRFLVISGNSLLKTFNSWKVVLWLLIPLSFFGIWLSIGVFLCRPTPELVEFIRKDFRRVFRQEVDDFTYLGGAIHESNGVISNSFRMGTAILLISVVCSFITIIIFGTKCFLCISRFTKYKSRSSRSLQSQLFFALVVQTLIPTVLMHVPVAVKIASAMFYDGIGVYCAFVSMAIAIYPAIDPLPYFFIISHYRKALFGWIRCGFKLKIRKVSAKGATGGK